LGAAAADCDWSRSGKSTDLKAKKESCCKITTRRKNFKLINNQFKKFFY
jgi:hypothetical protein